LGKAYSKNVFSSSDRTSNEPLASLLGRISWATINRKKQVAAKTHPFVWAFRVPENFTRLSMQTGDSVFVTHVHAVCVGEEMRRSYTTEIALKRRGPNGSAFVVSSENAVAIMVGNED
jgi:hypothetical protein